MMYNHHKGKLKGAGIMINKETYRWSQPKESKNFATAISSMVELFIGPKHLMFNILAILYTQVVILEGITPFVLPFAAIVPVISMPAVVLLTLLSGVFSQNSNILITITCIFVLWIIKKKTSDKSNYPMLVLPLLITFNYIPNLITSEFISFDLLLLALQIIMGLTAGYIFSQGFEVMRLDIKEKSSLESNICALIMLAIGLSGIASITINSFSIIGIVSKTFVLTIALVGGMRFAAAFGIIIGLVSNFSHPHITYFVSYYGFVGLTGGIMNQWKKTGVLLGFICGSIVMYIYGVEFFNIEIMIGESIIAAFVFMLIPKSITTKVEHLLNGDMEEKIYNKQLKIAAIKKIYQFSSIFKELSQGFNEVAISKYNGEQQGVNEVIDKIQNKTCNGCKKQNQCWSAEFFGTYKDVFKVISLAEEGNLENRTVPDQLFKKCINIKGIIDAANGYYELYRTNYKWQQKLQESKGLVANQLEGIAKVMEQLAMDINLDIGPRKDVEEELWDLLNNAGIECEDITVKGLERDKPEIQIVKRSCGGAGQCENIVTDIVEKRFKTQMCVLKGNCGAHLDKDGTCKFLLMSKERYKMSIAIAQKAQQEVCGDTFNHFAVNDGKHVIILSDGMGKGERAKEESERIVGLIKKMLQIGFDTEKAIKAVNSIMSLRNGEEMFATLDIAVVDLYKGKTEFYKNGAVASFIKSGNSITAIDGNSLPVGVVGDIGATTSSYTMQKGDFLIMISDGVLDTNPTAHDKEGWLRILLENITPNISPNRLAELILHKSRQRGIEGNLDDLSVVVIKMEGSNQPAVLGRWSIPKEM